MADLIAGAGKLPSAESLREKMKAAFFLSKSDKHRYGPLLADLMTSPGLYPDESGVAAFVVSH